jgi:hypothetical protein
MQREVYLCFRGMTVFLICAYGLAIPIYIYVAAQYNQFCNVALGSCEYEYGRVRLPVFMYNNSPYHRRAVDIDDTDLDAAGHHDSRTPH